MFSMTLRDGQRAEILFLLLLLLSCFSRVRLCDFTGKCSLEIPGELLDDYSTLLVETGTKASAVCDPWLFEAIGTTTLDSCRGGLLQAGLALLFSD